MVSIRNATIVVVLIVAPQQKKNNALSTDAAEDVDIHANFWLLMWEVELFGVVRNAVLES